MKTFKLEDRKIETGFVVPEGYFENFPERAMRRIAERETQNTPKIISLIVKRKNILMLVAATFLILAMIPLAVNISNKSAASDDSVMADYMVYQTNINQYDLIEDLDTDELNQIQTSILLEQDNNLSQILTSEEDLELLMYDN